MDKVVKATKADSVGESAPEATVVEIPAPVFLNEPKPETFPFTHPLSWNGEEYREARFHPMCGGDFSKLKLMAPVVGEDIAMIHLVTKLPVEVVQALHGDDYVEVAERIGPFLPARLREAAESASE